MKIISHATTAGSRPEFECISRDPSIDDVYKIMRLGNAVNRAHFRKSREGDAREASPLSMIKGLVQSAFIAPTISKAYASSETAPLMPSGRSAAYSFLAKPEGSWNSLLMNVGAAAAKWAFKADKENNCCLVFDDSVLQHSGARAMELCTWTHDHNLGCSVKGYDCLQAGWTDGTSFFSLGARLIASNEEEKPAAKKAKDEKSGKDAKASVGDGTARKKKHSQHACPGAKAKACDGRTSGAAIRRDASRSKFELAFEWAARAVRMEIPLRYVLVDSWFTSEGFLKNMKSLGPGVIGMLKMGNAFYRRKNKRCGLHWEGRLPDLARGIASKSRRRHGGPIIGTEILVRKAAGDEADEGIELKVVYVRAWNSDEILAIGSTDLSLAPERILQPCDRRWRIEAGFKNQKQLLGLGKSRSTDFDSLSAEANLACLREVFLEIMRRGCDDPRTIGGLFCKCSEAVHDRTVAEAVDTLVRMCSELPGKLAKAGCLAKGKEKKARRIIEQMICDWFAKLGERARRVLMRCRDTIAGILLRHGYSARALKRYEIAI